MVISIWGTKYFFLWAKCRFMVCVMVCVSLMPSQARTNVQTRSGDNARTPWAWKCDPAKI